MLARLRAPGGQALVDLVLVLGSVAAGGREAEEELKAEAERVIDELKKRDPGGDVVL